MKKIENFKEITDHYDCFFFDQFGVIHDGKKLYPGIVDIFDHIKAEKKKILLISNSGKRSSVNVRRMTDEFGLKPDTFDFAITSGELFWMNFKALKQGYGFGEKVYLLNRGNDLSAIKELNLKPTLVEKAEFILIAGLDMPDLPVEAVKKELMKGLERNLILICSNPDKTMIVGEQRYIAGGTLAEFYQQKGGKVIWLGKPHRPIFDFCLEICGKPKNEKVLMVGDSFEHDIAGADQCGIDSLLTLDGLCYDLKFSATATQETELEKLVKKYNTRPDYFIDTLKI